MKGAIFDVDGTLLDSMMVWYRVTEEFFRRNHMELPQELALRFQEMTLEESLPFMIGEYNLNKTVEELKREFYTMVEEHYNHKIQMKPYAEEYLKKLKQDGIQIAIATSGYQYLCESAFRRLGVWDLFDGVALSSEVKVNKTNPDVYLLAAERIGVAPTECVVFEDIEAGICGAKKAGMRTVAVKDETNLHITQQLKQQADRYIESWQELL